MALISFSEKEGETWVVGGPAFRQVLEDVLEQCPGDSEMVERFEWATESSGLCVDRLSPELADRVTNAIRHVTEGILDGTIRSGILDKPYGSPETLELYKQVLKKLRDAIPTKPQGLGPD